MNKKIKTGMKLQSCIVHLIWATLLPSYKSIKLHAKMVDARTSGVSQDDLYSGNIWHDGEGGSHTS